MDYRKDEVREHVHQGIILLNEKNDVTYLTFPNLEEAGVRHGFSTRVGGVSEGAVGSMNLGFRMGDDPGKVRENHRRLADAIGYSVDRLVFSDQVHGTEIRRVDASDCGKGILRESDIRGVDGLITDDPNVVLMTFFADCVPLFFYDTRHRAIGAVHSGWRGTVRRIGRRAVEEMGREFGTEPEDLLVAVGPSICQDCYEVGEDVADAFRKEFAREQWDELLIAGPDQKYRLDLWRANEIILQEAGIPSGQVKVSGLCTCCNSDFLFSHRASGGKRGSLAGVITLA